MDNRGTGRALEGMPKVNRMPKEWEKATLEMTKEPEQGPMKTSRPTARDFVPGNSVAIAGDFTRDIIAGRPGAVAQRALAPFPADVMDVLEASGAEVYSQFTGHGSEPVSTAPGDDGNVSTGGQGGSEEAKGSATKVTGRPVTGSVVGKGMI